MVGAANGTFDLGPALAEGWQAAGGETGAAPRTTEPERIWSGEPSVGLERLEGRVWVDLQNDVTTKDIALARNESFSAVEHLKRYTTLGMATDQGKTSNVNGLAVLAALDGREMGQAGVTTFRPPYAPVSFATIAATHRGELSHPVRRLPAEIEHRNEGAHFREYGGILRPAWYGAEEGAIARECLAARNRAIVFDGSPLGKIEVVGPDAPKLMDFIFYTRMSTLAPGRLRYGLMLTEGGAVFDDGVVLRLAEDRFVVSCSSSHVPAVTAHLEAWRQDIFDRRRVFVHDTTANWATIVVGGPGSKKIVERTRVGCRSRRCGTSAYGIRRGPRERSRRSYRPRQLHRRAELRDFGARVAGWRALEGGAPPRRRADGCGGAIRAPAREGLHHRRRRYRRRDDAAGYRLRWAA